MFLTLLKEEFTRLIINVLFNESFNVRQVVTILID
ncbi:MAG: hypothetical protein ACI9HU_001873 [Colwellia sp.]